jgi:single-strand DNA-binding protein
MFETYLTIVGHIVTEPQRRRVGSEELIKFRVASNSRRRTSDGGWEPGNSLFVTVNCWGRLVTGVGAALAKGAPVIVVGHVYTSEYEDRDGNRRSSVEMRATAVGPDLARTIVRIEKPSYTGPNAVEGPAAPTAPTDVAGDADKSGVVTADPDPAEVVVAGPGALPLSA